MSGKVDQKDKMTTANNIEQGRTIRKRFSPTAVYTPEKKSCHEIKKADDSLRYDFLCLLVNLRYLGKESFFSERGDLPEISQSTVCRAVEDVTTSICERVDIITFSTRDDDMINIKRICFTIAALPNVIGAIDRTLIPIIAPKENEADFVCRKGFHVINVQGVADDSLRYSFYGIFLMVAIVILVKGRSFLKYVLRLFLLYF